MAVVFAVLGAGLAEVGPPDLHDLVLTVPGIVAMSGAIGFAIVFLPPVHLSAVAAEIEQRPQGSSSTDRRSESRWTT